MNRKDNGFIYLGNYKYAKQLKHRGFALYEGMWSGRSENSTTGLEVVRNTNNKPLRFETLDAVKKYAD